MSLLVVVCCLVQGRAQQAGQAISGSFKEATLEEFAREVEAQTTYHFYFDAAATDSLSITLEVKEQPLSSVLSRIFQNTDFEFAIDTRQQVFITKGRQLSVSLPENFFEPVDSAPGYPGRAAAIQQAR